MIIFQKINDLIFFIYIKVSSTYFYFNNLIPDFIFFYIKYINIGRFIGVP